MAYRVGARVVFPFLVFIAVVHSSLGGYSIREDAGANTTVFNFTCTSDPDFSVDTGQGISSTTFVIRNTSTTNIYNVVLNTPFDREQTSARVVVHYCKNSGVSISLEGVNEYGPEFQKISPLNQSVVVYESDKVGKHLISVTLTDQDKPPETPSLLPATGNFSSELERGYSSPSEGQFIYTFSLKRTLDYESTKDHTFGIVLTAIDSAGHNVSKTFSITLRDSDDQSPKFTKDSFNCSIPEGHYNGSTTIKCTPPILAFDQDTGINATIQYKLLAVTPSISSMYLTPDGSLMASGVLDREKTGQYIISLQAYQTNRPLDRIAFATAIITVIDVDDNPPIMSQSTYTTSIMENMRAGAYVTRVSASDRDQGQNAEFEFKMKDSTNAFKINATTGIIYVKTSMALDRESRQNITMTVWAEGKRQSTKKSNFSTVVVTLMDENDNYPTFNPKGTSHTVMLLKNHTVETAVYQLNVTDMDEGENGQVHLKLQGAETGRFVLNSQTQTLKLLKPLVEDFRWNYTLTVIATDQATIHAERKSAYQTIIFKVQDVNMFSPRFCNGTKSQEIFVSEDTANGTILTQLCATDKDTTDRLMFSIAEGNKNNAFFIKNSYLKTKEVLDRETTESYNLTIVVKDPIQHIDTAVIRVHVMDANDNSPVFTQPQGYSFNLKEEQVPPVYVGTVQATDADYGMNADISYSLQDSWNASFGINKTSGVVSTQKMIDRDTLGKDRIDIVVLARDHGDPPRQTAVTVGVTVIDINDNAPQFNVDHVVYHFKEGTTPQNFHHLKASDGDEGTNGHVDFRLSNYTNFTLTGQRKNVLSLKTPLVFQSENETSLRVTIFGNNSNPYANNSLTDGKQIVTIIIEDVNDHSPVFSGDTTFQIAENPAFPRLVHRIVAIDDDMSAEFNTVRYWLDETHNNTFRIEPLTGELFAIAPLDFEKLHSPQFNFKVYASDMAPFNGSSKPKVKSASITVEVLDVNDNAPTFDKAFYTCQVEENYVGIINACLLTVTDADSGSNDINVVIQNGTSLIPIPFVAKAFPNGKWGLSLTYALDYERQQHTFFLNVTAKDVDKPSLQSSALVRVELVDVNDVAPKFVGGPGPFHFAVKENNAVGEPLGVIRAEDIDSKHLTFTLKPDDSKYLTINQSDKEVLVIAAKPFDYENMTQFTAKLTVNDSRNSTEDTIIVQVIAVNEYNPVFNNATYYLTVLEEATVQLPLNATDRDQGYGGSVASYSIEVPNQWKNSITLAKTTGVLTVSGLDRDTMGDIGHIQLIVSAADNGTQPRTGQAVVVITVEGINDNPPIYAAETINLRISEGAKYDSLYRSEAIDADKGCCARVWYRLKSGNRTLFKLDNTSGILSTREKLWIDNINNGSFLLQIEAHNSMNYSTTTAALKNFQTVHIDLTDVNNNSPVFSGAPYRVTVSESRQPGSMIKSVTATDADTSAKYNRVTYSIDGKSDVFRIDGTSGNIYLQKKLDYDPPQKDRSFNLTVTATDSQKNIQSQKVEHTKTSVIVTVQDANDNTPVFTSAPQRCSVHENRTGQLHSCFLEVTDIDSGSYNNFTLNISTSPSLHSEPFKAFKFRNKTWGISLEVPLDFEKQPHEFSLNVSATDTSAPFLQSSVLVIVQLLDVNDVAPKFVGGPGPFHFAVKENNAVGEPLGVIRAEDKDSPTLTFDLKQSENCLTSNQSGKEVLISAAKSFNYEDQTTCTVLITANDGNHTIQATVTVQIIAVNEFSPNFPGEPYSLTVPEETTRNTSMKAVDSDKGEGGSVAAYSVIVPEQWTHNIKFDNNTHLLIVTDLDRDTMGNIDVIQVLVNAVDNGTLPRTGQTVVTITVEGVNDHAPIYPVDKYNITITEGRPYNNIYQSKAVDKDLGYGAAIVYKANSSSSPKLDVHKNGTVYITSPVLMNDTSDGWMTLVIEASNNEIYSLPNLSSGYQTLNIYVKDINNNNPLFENVSYNTTIPESFSPGRMVLSVRATDADVDEEYRTITYWINNTAVNGTFRIDSGSGNIYLLRTLDYDPPQSDTSFKFKVLATDLHDHNATETHVASADVTITIKDVNDNYPRFSKQTYNFSIKEGTVIGPTSMCVRADDIDSHTNITYSLLDTGKSVNQTTGCIFVKETLAYGGTNSFMLNVTASDNDGTDPKTSSSKVTIRIVNVNNHRPRVLPPTKFSLYENNPVDQVIGAINVTDEDDPDGRNFSFSLSNPGFKISPQRMLLANKSFDRETDSRLFFVMNVTDGFYSVSSNLTVIILDQNDNSPIFKNKSYYFSVKENTRKVIGKIEADDKDEGNNSKIAYRLQQSDLWKANISLNQSSGSITVTALDRENIPSGVIEVVAFAKDHGEFPRSDTATIHIDVEDENDNPPYFVLDDMPLKGRLLHTKATENTNASLIHVFAKDADSTVSPLKYTIAKNCGDHFYFESNILSVHMIDREKQGPSCMLNISVSDGQHKAYANVNVTIVDVNDNKPYFANTLSNLNISDITPVGTEVMTVSAHDADPSNEGFTFVLERGATDFSIDMASGAISVAAPLKTQEEYELTVVVYDHGEPPLWNRTNIKVFASETNTQGPEFTEPSNPIVFVVEENDPSASLLINTSDPDKGDAGRTEYSIVSGNQDNLFTIDNTTGVVTLKRALNFEVKSIYEFVVQAIDHAYFPKSSTATVSVTVLDQNEPPILIIEPGYVYREVYSPPGRFVMTVSANDQDKDERFRLFSYTINYDENLFVINATTGVITTSQNLTVSGNFTLNVTVTDGGNLSDSKQLTVIVSNITGCNLVATIRENSEPPTVVKDVSSCANMSGQGLTYHIVQDDDSRFFTIDNKGVVRTAKAIDRESIQLLLLQIQGYDSTGSYMKVEIQLRVKVLDVNDNTPTFDRSKFYFNMKENSPVNVTIGTVTATDVDENPKFHYTIVDTNAPKDLFSVDDAGHIRVNALVDREAMDANLNDTYFIKLVCNDSVYTSNETEVFIHVEDENDRKPEFIPPQESVNVSESEQRGYVVSNRSAVDPDLTPALTYSITEGNAEGFFKINRMTGEVFLDKRLHYEEKKSFSLVVLASDTNKSAKLELNITVIDVNDHAPQFNHTEYRFTLPEGQASLESKNEVSAFDMDAGSNSVIEFSILADQFNGGDFNVTTYGNKGIIMASTPLDRENNNVQHINGTAIYRLTVKATDRGQPPLNTISTIEVWVTDINDCTPRFTEKNYSVSVQESQPTGFITTVVTAVDDDDLFFLNKTRLIYSLNGTGSDNFNISSSGKIAIQHHVDLSGYGIYNLTVYASDGKHKGSAPLTITVLDINDHDPVFNETTYTFNVMESNATWTTGVVVGHVHATDADKGNNGLITYSIPSTSDDVPFNITAQTGEIVTTGPLDRERVDHYKITVTASDHASTGPRKGNCEVKIIVEDLNDNSPELSETMYTGTIQESSKRGTPVDMTSGISATDPDSGIYGTAGIRYSFVNGKYGRFCIDANTANVTFCNSTIVNDGRQRLEMEIKATDTNGTGLGSYANLTIIFLDDIAPVFTGQDEFSISESVSHSTFGKIEVSDQSYGRSKPIHFAITSGDFGRFAIDRETGNMSVIEGLDREQRAQYKLNVTATDDINMSWKKYTIHILDVNDNAPRFNQSSVTLTLPENNKDQDPLHQFHAFDLDEKGTNNSNMTFFMNSTGNFFNVTEDGYLTVLKEVDRELNPSFDFYVYVRDHGKPALTSSVSVHVTIGDVNDNSPVFIYDGKKNISEIRSYIVEKSPVRSVLALVVATDPDAGNNGSVHFETSGSEKILRYFSINKTNGLVTLAKSIDINTLANQQVLDRNDTDHASVSFSIVAVDAGPSPGRSTRVKFTVFIEETNDLAPRFTSPVYRFTVNENMPKGTFIGQTTAIVPNATNSHLSFSLLSTANTAAVDTHNGTLYTKQILDREKESRYTFAVQVVDGRIPERTAFAAVEIAVSDDNDNAPVFGMSSYTYHIEENTNITYALPVRAKDQDVNENADISYTLTTTFGGKFLINATAGDIYVNGPLNREQTANYTLHVVAQDSGVVPKSASVSIEVIVLDKNDNSPVFQTRNTSFYFKENKAGQSFGMRATDADAGLNGQVVYKLDGKDKFQFGINPINGTVTSLAALDFELKQEYHLEIVALDLGTPQRSTNLNVTVHVGDSYDKPMCRQSLYERELKSETKVGTHIVKVTAGSHGLNYTISEKVAGSFFHIDHVTGDVTLSRPLDKRRQQYTFDVVATDSTTAESTSCKVIVYIKDYFATFPKKEYTTSLVENGLPQILIELNTTEELEGYKVAYRIVLISPNVSGAFHIDPETGTVHCDKSLNREDHSLYDIYISASRKTTRRKRSITDSNIVKLTVRVTDVNDNPPEFSRRQRGALGVPYDAKANYIVETIAAIDRDEGLNAAIEYTVTSGDTDVFGIDRDTGQLKCLVDLESVPRKNFSLVVMATDENGLGNNSTLKLAIFKTDQRLILQAKISQTEFRRHEEEIVSNMSTILGVGIQIEAVLPHTIHNTTEAKISLDYSDIYFHGVNHTTGTAVSISQMLKLLKENAKELQKLFQQRVIEIIRVPIERGVSPADITGIQITLICLAVFILVASALSIALSQYMWTRYNSSLQQNQKNKEVKMDKINEIEFDTLRSRRSSQLTGPIAAVNPAFTETEFITRQAHISSQLKAGPQYESQELRMDFQDDAFADDTGAIDDHHRDGNNANSIADSGVENESSHSGTDAVSDERNSTHASPAPIREQDELVGQVLEQDDPQQDDSIRESSDQSQFAAKEPEHYQTPTFSNKTDTFSERMSLDGGTYLIDNETGDTTDDMVDDADDMVDDADDKVGGAGDIVGDADVVLEGVSGETPNETFDGSVKVTKPVLAESNENSPKSESKAEGFKEGTDYLGNQTDGDTDQKVDDDDCEENEQESTSF